MSLKSTHISFDNIKFPELKMYRRPVMKVKEWLKTKKHLLLVSNSKEMVLHGIFQKFEIECETYLKLFRIK